SGSIPMTGPSSASGMGGGMPSMGGAATTTSGTSTSTTTTSTTNIYDLLNAAGTKWSAAVVGDQSASGYILNTNTAVFCIGGWTGSDNNVTLDQFKALVSSGQIHYFLVGGGMGGGPGGGSGTSATQITSWVTSTFTSSTVGGVTVYDLTTQA
ncbi:MAG: glycosyl transferase, partial [Propionibacteriaceae bacterium]